MRLPLANDNPNFSLVMPGFCNASCNFCFFKPTEMKKNYFDRLDDVMTGNVLPDVCHQISLTGGEPTASPIFVKVLNRINREMFKKVVLTTNGFRLNEHINDLIGIVDHVNISRHHYNNEINNQIFGTNSIPSNGSIKNSVKEMQELGIDVTLNCVTSHIISAYDVYKYIDFGRQMGINHICFRKLNGNLDLSEIEKYFFEKYPTFAPSRCPVCRKDEQMIKDQHIVWRAGTLEPSNDLKGIYEFIMQQSGDISVDWSGKVAY